MNAHAPRTHEGRKGRLVGWLVSYGLSDSGAAYEIRSGRTFVSSNDGAVERCIAVVDSTIDSPHLAIKASQKHRVHVQDIFSRVGSFIQRNDSDQEVRIDGPTEIEHGDWIRLGDSIRFQVCLIDSPGR